CATAHSYADGRANNSTVRPTLLVSSADGPQRLVRFRRDEVHGRPALPCRELRPRARILARLRLDFGVAAVHLERLHVATDVVVAGHFPRPDLRNHPADHLSLG